MTKWKPEDLSTLDLRILIERLRGVYRNVGVSVLYQPSPLELEAARRLELCLRLLDGRINADLVLEMAKAAYEAANKETSKENRDWELPSWDNAPPIDKLGWVTGVGTGIFKFLSSLREGGGADGIMGKQNREAHSQETEKRSDWTDWPERPLTGL